MVASASKTSRWKDPQQSSAGTFELSDHVSLTGLVGLTTAVEGTFVFSAGEDWTRLFVELRSNNANDALLADHTVVVSLRMRDGRRDVEWGHHTLVNPPLGSTIELPVEAPSPEQGIVGEIVISVEQYAATPVLESVVAVLGKPRRMKNG